VQLVAWVTGYGHGSSLRRVTKLTVASVLAHHPPFVGFDQLDDRTNLDPART
jgi:hypothetical protein